MRILFIALLSIVTLVSQTVRLPLRYTSGLGLIDWARDSSYSGSFRMPNSFSNGVDTIDTANGNMFGQVIDAGGGVKYLVMGGQKTNGGASGSHNLATFAKIQVPVLLNINSVGVNGLNRASIVSGQNFVDLANGLLASNVGCGSGCYTNGIIYGSKILGSSTNYYDGSCDATTSIFWVQPTTDFSASQSGATGMYHVTETGPALEAGTIDRVVGGGFMTLIPSVWQSALGGKVLSGTGAISITRCGTVGPSLHVIADADALAAQPSTSSAITTYGLMYMPNDHPRLGRWDWDDNKTTQTVDGHAVPYFSIVDPIGGTDRLNPLTGNTTTWNINWATGNSEAQGVVFPDSTSSVLVLGRIQYGKMCYGDPAKNEFPPTNSVQGVIQAQNTDASTIDSTHIRVPNVNTSGMAGGHIAIWLTSQTSPAGWFGGDKKNAHPGMGIITGQANSGTPTAQVTVSTGEDAVGFTVGLTSQAYKIGEQSCETTNLGAGKGLMGWPESAFIWGIDANDLARVKAGSILPYEVVPYGGWPLTMVGDSNGDKNIGAAWDPATRNVYIGWQNGDGPNPLVHVFHLAVPPMPFPFPLAIALLFTLALPLKRRTA